VYILGKRFLRGKVTNFKIVFGLKHSWQQAIDYADSEYQGLYGPWIDEESGFLENRVFGQKLFFQKRFADAPR